MKDKHTTFSFAYRILLLISVGVAILGQLARISFSNNLGFLYLDIIVLFFSLFTLAIADRKWMKEIAKKRILCYLIIFYSVIAFSLAGWAVLYGNLPIVGIMYALRFFTYSSLVISFSYGLEKHIVSRAEMEKAVLLISIGIAILGIIQYVFIPDVRFLSLMGWDDHYYRLVSTLFDPPFTGAVIGIGLLLLQSKRNKKPLSVVSWIVMFIAFMLTYSRASYICYLIASGIQSLQIKTKIWFVGLLILTIFSMVLLPRPASEGTRLERTQSIVARKETLVSSLRSISIKTLLVGNGWYMTSGGLMNTALPYIPSRASASDNSYLHVLESTGLFGLVVFCLLLVTMLKSVKNNYWVLPSYIFLGIGALANNLLFYPHIMFLIWMMYAVSQAKE